MTKIYVNESPTDGVFRLNRDYKRRLVKVMRSKVGDAVIVFSTGKKWECRVKQILPDEIHLEILKELDAGAQPGLYLMLAQTIPKGDRFEWLIQKATELGVAEIFPLITERSVVKPAVRTAKLQRWNAIAEQAAGQSENSYPPTIHPPQTLPSFLERNMNSQLQLLLHERKDAIPLHKLITDQQHIHRITFIVGPEGGWTEAETDRMLAAGYRLVHLGPRILRAETCGLVMATLLQYELGDFRTTQ